MNKIISMLVWFINKGIKTIYDPVKALENEQIKLKKKCLTAYNNYKTSLGNLEVQKGNVFDTTQKIEKLRKNLEIHKSMSRDEKARATATEIVLLTRQNKELSLIIEENAQSLKLAKRALEALVIKIANNDAKLSNLKIKQQMNGTTKILLSILSLNNAKYNELTFDSVNKQLVDEQRQLTGEGKALNESNEVDYTLQDEVDLLLDSTSVPLSHRLEELE